jgi:preprotein translocase SecE subunit
MAAANLSLGGRISRPFVRLYQFFQAVWFELQRVVWPSKEETYTFTLVVIVAVIAVAAYMGALDLILNALTKAVGIY